MSQAYLDMIDSPVGSIQFTTNSEGALLRLSFLDGHYPLTLQQELERDGFTFSKDMARTEHARIELLEFFAGKRRTFDVPVILQGSPFQVTVWSALRRIPFGETRTYAQLAGMIERPAAARAVGRANATNRIPLVIPCHRVIGADGSLTGFAGGIHLKERLLAFEMSHMTPEEEAAQQTRQSAHTLARA
jgi:methylated-DNA-[protein]-cysteine S-methyltransferase